MIIHDIDQRSDEWFEIRKLKMTASHAQEIGNNGKGLETYIKSIMQEYYSSAERESFSNKHTERGVELEPEAIFRYEMESKSTVEKVGFVEYSKYVGCSPDGFVNDGLIEVKCPDDKAYFELLLSGKPESKYVWQMQMQMLTTGRLWCDFVAYNPNFKQDIIIIRYEADLNKFESLRLGFGAGQARIEEIIAKMGAV